MIENKKVITWSLLVLFLSLAMVYSLTYMKKATLFKAVDVKWDEISNQTWAEIQNQWSITEKSAGLSNISGTSDSSKAKNSTSASLGGSTKSSWVSNSNTQTLSTSKTGTKKLPGTTEYYWMLDIVSILGEKPEFTLQDSKWNYFAYYGNHLNFIQTVKTLGGNVYEMVTEAEILQNQLFGDRVSYINLSMFKDTRVLMVIEIDGNVWLLQIPADKYHQSKDYLKSLFIQ